MKHILAIVTGNTPQVVTETLFALSVPPHAALAKTVIAETAIAEINLLTTAQGKPSGFSDTRLGLFNE